MSPGTTVEACHTQGTDIVHHRHRSLLPIALPTALPIALPIAAALLLGACASPSSPPATAAKGTRAEGHLVTVATVQAKPGKENDLRAATVPLIAATRGEAGVVTYVLHEQLDAPGRFVFYEVFRDETAFQEHVKAAYVQQWLQRLPELTVNGITVTRLKAY